MNKGILIAGISGALVVIGCGIGGAMLAVNMAGKSSSELSAQKTDSDEAAKVENKLNGWQNKDDNWYFYKDDEKLTGWVQDQNSWYYLGTDGKRRTGWIKDNDKWYYLNTDGTMAYNTTVDGKHLNEKGIMEENEQVGTKPGSTNYDKCLNSAKSFFENKHGSDYKYTVQCDTTLNDKREYTFFFYDDSQKLVDGCYVNSETKYTYQMSDVNTNPTLKNRKSVQARLEGVWKLSYRNDLIYITNKMWGEYYYTVVEEQEDSIVIDIDEKGHTQRLTVNLNKDYPDSIGILEYTGGDNNYAAIGIGTRYK